jgi:hypothetical protein
MSFCNCHFLGGYEENSLEKENLFEISAIFVGSTQKHGAFIVEEFWLLLVYSLNV